MDNPFPLRLLGAMSRGKSIIFKVQANSTASRILQHQFKSIFQLSTIVKGRDRDHRTSSRSDDPEKECPDISTIALISIIFSNDLARFMSSVDHIAINAISAGDTLSDRTGRLAGRKIRKRQ